MVAAFNSGYTLALYSVEKKLTQLLPLVQNLEKELSSTISGILFVSPKSGSQGFLTHYDEDDNYLLQLHGRKRWLVWKPELDWTPGSKQFDNNEIEKLGEPVIDAILETGDSLYVPRGWIHCVLGVGETSMHLSLIPDATTWLDLVQEGMHALFESLAKDSRFNKSLPLGLMRIDEAVLQPQFEILVKLLPENVDFSATLNNIKVKIRRTMLARTDSHFLRSTEQINSITLVRVRPGLRNELQIFSSRNAVGLKFVGNELELPAEAAPAIEFMIDRDSFQAKDIPLNVEVETKIQLIQDLIRGTFLEVVH